MKKAHTYRIKSERWEAIKDKAWELSKKKDEIIKPTDVVDAILLKGINDLEIKDVENLKKLND